VSRNFGLTLFNIDPPDPVETIRSFYTEAFRKLAPDRPEPPIDVRFYPYVGINHTIRVRAGRVYVRIAEICRDLPTPAQRALAYILVSKLLGRRIPKIVNETYSEAIRSPKIRFLATENRRSKGRKVVTDSAGEFYHLEEIFDRLNAQFFGWELPKPRLSWSSRQTYRMFGHHDATHDTIVISRSLDSRDTPAYVVDYVVFHEMLHIHHPTRHVNGRRYNHTAAFRRDERKFPKYEEAERWIEQSVRRLKRRARKK
jgi:hypothetical protein